MGNFDVYVTDDTITSIGLHWGESGRLQKLGISRKNQIKMLDWLEDNPKIAKKLLVV